MELFFVCQILPDSVYIFIRALSTAQSGVHLSILAQHHRSLILTLLVTYLFTPCLSVRATVRLLSSYPVFNSLHTHTNRLRYPPSLSFGIGIYLFSLHEYLIFSRLLISFCSSFLLFSLQHVPSASMKDVTESVRDSRKAQKQLLAHSTFALHLISYITSRVRVPTHPITATSPLPSPPLPSALDTPISTCSSIYTSPCHLSCYPLPSTHSDSPYMLPPFFS
ncbi:hypothetical protein BJ912DRAFT_13790 [Pholiota molesta]|nr:hypothetical protein BJ912DRAFT_13790 [Pholiota molesta]